MKKPSLIGVTFLGMTLAVGGYSMVSTMDKSETHAQSVSGSPAQGVAGTNGTNGTNGATGATGPTGASGVNAFGTPTSRSLVAGTALQAADPTRPAIVTITLTSTANFSLSGGTTNSADVVIGTTSGIGTSGGSTMGKYSNSVTGSIAVGLNMNSIMTSTYTLALPIGGFFALRQTAGAVTITSTFDQSVG